jgi:hypothetical protein
VPYMVRVLELRTRMSGVCCRGRGGGQHDMLTVNTIPSILEELGRLLLFLAALSNRLHPLFKLIDLLLKYHRFREWSAIG